MQADIKNLFKNSDINNIICILLAYFSAHFLPVKLLLFSYAFLGPAHYLTQIAWLNKRKYFTTKNNDFWFLILITFLLIIFSNYYFLLIATSLVLALAMTLYDKWLKRVIFIIPLLITILILSMIAEFRLILALIPTLIHVFIFTAAFMLFGAIKTNNKKALLGFFLLIICASSYFLPIKFNNFLLSSDSLQSPDLAYFHQIFKDFLGLFSISNQQYENMIYLIKFTAFAYCYHYLNWFIKVEVIGWNLLSKKEMIFLSIIYIAAISAYIIDYSLGFKILLYLSLLHVILELPLNMRCFKGLIFYQKSNV